MVKYANGQVSTLNQNYPTQSHRNNTTSPQSANRDINPGALQGEINASFGAPLPLGDVRLTSAPGVVEDSEVHGRAIAFCIRRDV